VNESFLVVTAQFNAGLVAAFADGRDWTDALAAATRLASTLVARPSVQRYPTTFGKQPAEFAETTLSTAFLTRKY
jgi:hypothetical protein